MSAPRQVPRKLPRNAVEVGERVYLRHPVSRDREEFLAACRRSQRLHRPWTLPPRDDAEFDRYLLRAQREDHAGFLVCRLDNDAIVGVININQIVRGLFQSGYLGYYAFAPHTGEGHMRQGLQLVMRHAFGKMKLHRLEANVQPGNDRSVGLVKQSGFRLEGLSRRYLKIGGKWRDHQRWAITVEVWQPWQKRRAATSRSGTAAAIPRSRRGATSRRRATRSKS